MTFFPGRPFVGRNVQKSNCQESLRSLAPITDSGCCHVPRVRLSFVTMLELITLKMSALTTERARPNLRTLPKRKSSWFSRSP